MTATRRRGTELEAAIHRAVIDELTCQGYGGLTFEGVAAAAATSKAVLYRRWPTKAELILSAVVATNRPLLTVPDTGTLRGDLCALLAAGRSQFGERREVLLGLLADLDGEAADTLRAMLFARSAELVQPIVDQAVVRGELGTTPIAPRALTVAVDLLRHETLLRGRLRASDIYDLVDQCVLPLLVAASADVADPLVASRDRAN